MAQTRQSHDEAIEKENQPGHLSQPPVASISKMAEQPNIYVGMRNFIHQLMDVALVMANVSQLKTLLSLENKDKYYYPIFVFILMSIGLQDIFTICVLMIWSIEKKLDEHKADHNAHKNDRRQRLIEERLDKFCNILVLLIIVSNVFITAFGVEPRGGGDNEGKVMSVVGSGTQNGTDAAAAGKT
ncbi:ninjurin-1-like isoform X2 [Dreissena polymorpha]|uniref:ninjurin-1-like isoform X2 n=1 Tax=Dreissena polymorpha TaxID=45954 RepID=UPI002264A9BD|nr:ninjurin-1-like isoform X2 [Dreissena polymorpha]